MKRTVASLFAAAIAGLSLAGSASAQDYYSAGSDSSLQAVSAELLDGESVFASTSLEGSSQNCDVIGCDDGCTSATCDCSAGGCCKPLVSVFGRVFLDNVWSSDFTGAVPQALPNSQFSAQNSRIGLEGWLTDNINYRAELNFIDGDVDWADLYVEANCLPLVGNMRVGNFVEPFSMDRLTRREFLPFMEHSAPTQNYAPARNLGLMLYDDFRINENFSWYASVAKGNSPDDLEHLDNDDWAVTGRIAGLLASDCCCHRFLHIGGAMSARRTGNNIATLGNGQWLGRIPLDNLNSLSNIVLGPGRNFNAYNAELAWVNGPLAVQSEAYYLHVNSPTPTWVRGVYAQASYFLTGEQREYDHVMRTMGRLYPNDPVFGNCCRGRGAWEVALRYDHNNLNSIPALLGPGFVPPTVIGDQSTTTAALNWHLTCNSHLSLNYTYSHAWYTFIGSSTASSYGVRFAVDF